MRRCFALVALASLPASFILPTSPRKTRHQPTTKAKAAFSPAPIPAGNKAPSDEFGPLQIVAGLALGLALGTGFGLAASSLPAPGMDVQADCRPRVATGRDESMEGNEERLRMVQQRLKEHGEVAINRLCLENEVKAER
mmetsp:Transcript_45636/g.85193  ORF Transcript_45636/g.85193 Transcript_45636/m.85193 type:complete len:139 (-) Transcript_45636:44-460(-)